MSKPTKPATKETQDRIELEVPSVEPDAKPPSSQSKIDEFVKRRDEVAARDHDEFQDYLRLKEEEQARKGDELVPAAADYTARREYRARGRRHGVRHQGAKSRQLGGIAANQDGRRNLCDRPAFEPRAGVHPVLELRRLQSDQPSSLRLSQRGSETWLRVRQQHAGRTELTDLRHA